ncbi:hypothetical protein [Limnohabitans sp. 63ED37-2]|uniref:hypothetical protein n=1 Tax=Limnohabitans sp. 63ED37-2 TaxID=1678128 RepID=UPI000782D8C8|nr:hypothetical protein [Limnohabitans sp. 63ED37-2]
MRKPVSDLSLIGKSQIKISAIRDYRNTNMACSRGAASPNAHTQRRLFAASAGYCQNPSCSNELFVDAAGVSIHIAEMAHVFAATDGGPRTKPALSKEERGAFGNLVMLCANCHTMVDKAPSAYPDQMMLGWKREHANKLQGLFGAVKFGERSGARAVVEPLLAENHAIFIQYGPHIDAARNPESGAAEQWKRKMLTRILPNDRRILAILDANRHLLGDYEKTTLEQFRQHIDDLEAFHIEGNREDASRFPNELPKILKD